MSWFAPNIFWTFYQFSGSLPNTIQHVKTCGPTFFCFGKIWPILTLNMVKIKNFEFFHKIENDYSIKINNLYSIVKVKNFNFWLCPKSKCAVPYLAETAKRDNKYFWIFNSKWQTTRILVKGSKDVGGKLTHFCLRAKTRIGRWDPHFTLRSKIFVFCSTFW